MKRLTALLLFIGLCAAALSHSTTHAQRPEFSSGVRPAPAAKFRKNAAPAQNRYIVVLNDSVTSKQVSGLANALTRAHGGTLGSTYQNALRGFSVEMSEAQAEALSRNPQVAFVEEDTLVEGASTQANAPWALDRLDQRDLTPNSSYTYASDGAGVNAYVIDGGIRMTHQEFGGRAAFAFDNVNDGRNGSDCNGHGTHVAGIIGGNTYGVAKGVKLWSVRVLNCSNQSLASGILAGIDWLTVNHVKPAVANLSFASGVGNDALDLAVRNLIAAGVTTVVAAGNNNGDAALRSPARVGEAITVAATDQNDVKTSLSNFGSVVDVFAPGAAITSAHSTDDAAVFTRTGTSSAAPFVAGLVARYLSTRPGDAPDAVSQAITNDATVGKVVNAGEGSPNRLAYSAITISDDFNDNTPDTTKWNVAVPPGGTIVEQNGRVEVTPPASTTGYGGYYSATTVDLTNSRISVEVTPGNAGGYGAETYLSLAQGNNYVLFATGGGNLLFQTAVNGAMSRTYIPYSPTQHRFWRLRHNRATDEIFWETSPDGVTWTVQRTVVRAFPITNLQTQLQAGKYTATTPGGTTIYDNLWHEPNPTPPVVLADDFNDNSINTQMWTASDPNSPTTVAEQNGRLEVTLQPYTAGYNSTGVAGRFDFRDKTLQVELQTASQAGWVETYFQLYLDSGNYLLFDTGAGSFTCDAWVNGVRDRTLLNWDGSRFWRFRHDSDANTVSFETSMDGTTWATRKTIAASFPLHSVTASIGAGAWGTGNGAPGTAAFDNFRLERYKPLFPLSDNFNDNTRDAKRWNTAGAAGMNIVEQNGQLQITPPASTTGYDGYFSPMNIDLSDARATVEVVQSTGLVYGIETTFTLADQNGNYMLFDVGGGGFLCQQSVNGVMTRTLLGYDAAQFRFWRFRHNRAADTINWETSPDGITWTTRRTEPRSFPITNLQTQLYAGKYTATTTAYTAIFDNLRIERNEGGKTR
ncbi:MAG TPA: S8 family peptidase [Pyrinomonadaceae bacterium]|nr:S8 family peptidase [Pyrinomonadaceae bacterium]